MARIVLVHGIAQEQHSADTLEAVWLPALAGGIRAAGHPGLADQLWRDRPNNAIGDVRMAFYGDLFLTPGQQGPAAGPINDYEDIGAEQAEVMAELAKAWLENTARHAPDPVDRALAETAFPGGNALQSQGKRVLRPAMNALARIHWFAAAGTAAASLAWPALRQVSAYLTDTTLRRTAQHRVLDLIGPDTDLVIAHSLGTVIAYEALHHNPHPVALITLGSPLGLRNVIYERLQPQPSTIPACLTRWDNLADLDDIIAAHTNLAPLFPPQPGHHIAPTAHPGLDNGAQPHNATHYLTKPATGHLTHTALTPRP